MHIIQAKMLVEGDDAVTLRERMAHLPLVLMSEDNNEHRVLSGIKLGACDFLDKPLSSLKLKNIWQHVVRKMMEHADEDDDECLAFDEACFQAAASIKGGVRSIKSEASLQAPKTPSPVTSTADLFSMVASQSKGGISADTAGESATSEATREETSKRVLRSVRRRSTGSAPAGYGAQYHQGMMMPHPHGIYPPPSHGMVMVPQPKVGAYYSVAPPMSTSMPCMGFMPTPMVVPPTCAAQAAESLPEGLFAPTATYLPPEEPDLTTVSVDKAGPIGLTLHKSPSLLALLNEPAK